MYEKLITDIINNVGGKTNIIEASYDATRLKLKLKNKIDLNALNEIEGLYKVVHVNNLYQFVIGPKIENFFNKFILLLNKSESKSSITLIETRVKTLYELTVELNKALSISGAGGRDISSDLWILKKVYNIKPENEVTVKNDNFEIYIFYSLNKKSIIKIKK